jgi:adenylate cyclase class 2
MRSGRHKEVEVKLCVGDVAGLLSRLRKLRAQRLSRVFERNVLYDFSDRALMKRDSLLRLRWEFPAGRESSPTRTGYWLKPGQRHYAGVRAWLTYKGHGNRSGRYKMREELELAIGDPDTLAALLKAVGLHSAFHYEKFRTCFRLPQVPGVAVELDETPIGTYLELEGRPRGIDRAARLLGRSPGDYITASYYVLYCNFYRRRRRPIRHMAFSARES